MLQLIPKSPMQLELFPEPPKLGRAEYTATLCKGHAMMAQKISDDCYACKLEAEKEELKAMLVSRLENGNFWEIQFGSDNGIALKVADSWRS